MKHLNWMPRNLSKGNFIILLSLIIVGSVGSTAFTETPPPVDPMEDQVTQGALRLNIRDEVVECPLKHTDVKVDISGFIARATVTQTFYNPYDENIEAVYVYPLPHTAAIDAMTMKIGERTIVGVMKRRVEARAIYEQAIQQGKTASLLEQERPNIFTQWVGNIKPREEIHIEISYVDVLDYDMGTYEFHFPMVVGPRYIGEIEERNIPFLCLMCVRLEGKVGEIEEPIDEVTLSPDPSGTGWSPDTNCVPDASRITPPILKPGYRTAHDIRLSVSLDAGVPIQDIESVNHTTTLERIDASKARMEIAPMDSIPNKDFVMKYKVVGEKPEMAVFAHAAGPEQRYFMLMIQPKFDAALLKASPRELVFLIDTSASMSGEPMAKVRAAMRQFLHLSKPGDTLQVITFAGQANSLFEKSVSATQENIARALNFTQHLHSGGGTEMLEGIKAVLNASIDPKRGRIVVLLTDGYIGNEAEIIAEVGKRANDAIHFWTIGIGSSPNRFLIDGVARQSGGMSEVLDLNTNPKQLATRIMHRIHRAQLTDIQMDWKQLAVYETYPRRIPELWADRPVILFGRYASGGSTKIALSGTAEGEPLTYTLDVTLPDAEPAHDVLAKVWARKKIEDLSAQMYHADTPEVVEEITRIALDYRLMSQYTSFAAVDESDIADIRQQAKPPRRVVVPVPLPGGVDFEGHFGELQEEPQFFYAPPTEQLRMGGPKRDFPFDSSQALLAPTKRVSPILYPIAPPMEQMRVDGPKRDFPFDSSLAIQQFLDTGSVKRHADAKAAVAEAQTLQQGGHLEEARLRYQHALGLMAGIRSDSGPLATASVAIQSLSDVIVKKRAEMHPRLNRKLNLIIRNQPLTDAIRTLVTAGGFQLDWVPGSLEDVTALLYMPECRVTYLDLQHATVAQGLTWLLAPYHLTWQMKDAETITIGTARRMPGGSVWGYDVNDIVIPVAEAELNNKAAPLKSVENALTRFLKTIKVVVDQETDSQRKSDSAVLLPLNRLLVYGDPERHQKMHRFLEVLRDPESDITSIKAGELSEETRADLKTLQKLTTAESKKFAEVRQFLTSAKAHQRVSTDLQIASWQLLAEALKGEIHLEALTRLQMAWASPELEAVIEENRYLAMRSAWCIRTAARTVPTDMELAALSESVLSKVRQTKVLKSEGDSFSAHLGTLYAVLALRDEDAPDKTVDLALKALMKEIENADLETLHLIAESLFSPSEKRDKTLQAALSADQIDSEDLVLLTGLIAKRRGGQLWQTFWEELPAIASQSRLSGHIVVIISRLAASDAFVKK